MQAIEKLKAFQKATDNIQIYIDGIYKLDSWNDNYSSSVKELLKEMEKQIKNVK